MNESERPSRRRQVTRDEAYSEILENVGCVLDQGHVNCDRIVRQEQRLRVECGDVEIKERRRSRKVGAPPGGVVADYVPFYFAPRSPMLYKINKGSVPTYDEGQDPLVYLVTTPRTVHSANRSTLFSDGNCAADITAFANSPTELETHVDWAVMRAERWNNTPEDPDRMRRRMAEFLVHESLPLSCVHMLATRTAARAERVRELLRARGCRIEVVVRDAWYY